MFWFVRYRIPFSPSPLRPDQRLRQTLAKGQWSRIESTVTEERVKLQHRTPAFMYNSWNPVFDGRFIQDGTEPCLVGYFRVHWLVIAFSLAMLGSLVFELVSTLAEPAVRPGYSPGWRGAQVRDYLEFIVAFISITGVGWLIGVPYERRILAALYETAAPPGPGAATRPATRRSSGKT